MFHKMSKISMGKIAREWNDLAPVRFQQITSGDDISYHHVLIPNILALMPRQPVAAALDAGCGIGFLTNLLTDRAVRVVGVDVSPESIKIAQAHFGKHIEFVHKTIEDHST
jgi:2-polyprenyl-3-methyl-5-hydroxy-6-metoxy-1,4-benzoquinol methylase